MSHLLYKDEAYAIVGAAMEVYYRLGVGFAEPIYQECFAMELAHRRIPFESEFPISMYYRDKVLTKTYRPDFLCFEEIIVELKAMQRLGSNEEAQILNYLKVSRKKLGLLINFGSRPKLEWKRYVLSLAV